MKRAACELLYCIATFFECAIQYNTRAAYNKEEEMINAKGQVIYTNAEIAYELGISPATVNACAKRLFGTVRVPHWTLNDAKLICRYIKSISVEEDTKRLLALHEAIQEIMGENSLDDVEVRKSVDKDTHLKEEIPEGGI